MQTILRKTTAFEKKRLTALIFPMSSKSFSKSKKNVNEKLSLDKFFSTQKDPSY